MDPINQVERVLNGLTGSPQEQLEQLMSLRTGYLDLTGAGRKDETRQKIETRIIEISPRALSPIYKIEKIIARAVGRSPDHQQETDI